MEVQGERMYNSYSFMTSALDGGEWSASAPAALYLRGKDTRYPLDKRLGGPQSWSGQSRGKILFCLRRGSNLDHPVVQSVARHILTTHTNIAALRISDVTFGYICGKGWNQTWDLLSTNLIC
jgi:hypothetical protein